MKDAVSDMHRSLGECYRQAGSPCSLYHVSIVRDASGVRSCARNMCLRCWSVFRFGVLLLLLLSHVAPLVSRLCSVHFSSCPAHFFHLFIFASVHFFSSVHFFICCWEIELITTTYGKVYEGITDEETHVDNLNPMFCAHSREQAWGDWGTVGGTLSCRRTRASACFPALLVLAVCTLPVCLLVSSSGRQF